ncbi:Uncharacterised protein [Mycobacterium tuberculosis]|nr:Uncharacterised protein [Mycobacterium tuberculosis]
MVRSYWRAAWALLSAEAAWTRALDAWLKAIDISPPHFDASNPHHAVMTAVMDSSTTVATSNHRPG